MASEKNEELDTMAFELFTKTPLSMRGEKVVTDCYRKAQEFITCRDSIRSGKLEVKKPEGPQLADCCAPNLPRNHPHNLVAAVYTDKAGAKHLGDIEKINRIKKWLDANPTPETDQDQIVPRLAQSFPELGWDASAILTARAVFPAYCKN